MYRARALIPILFSAFAASTSAAQAPGPGVFGGGPRGGPLANPAAFLLARTGELKLTDAQVVRLAAIARRADDRRRAFAAQLDSLRPPASGRGSPGGRDSAASADRERTAARMRPAFERLREQEHGDLRDAITVLTAEQQATAWELVSGRGASPGGGFGAGTLRVPSPRRGGFGPERGGRGSGPRRSDEAGLQRSRRPPE